MGLSALGEISRQLIAHGLSSDWPLLLVENGSRPEQRQLLTTLADAATAAQSMALQSPCLILVGEVVRRQRQMAQLVGSIRARLAAEMAA